MLQRFAAGAATTVMVVFIRNHPAIAHFLLAFTLGTLPLLLVAGGYLPPGFSQLGALSASAAGFMLAALEGGKAQVLELLQRGRSWRHGFGWWALCLFYLAPIAVAALGIANLAGEGNAFFSELPALPGLFPMMLVLIVLAGLGEEFGWRGYLLPRLQSKHSALGANLIVGVCHSLWHLPLFLVEGTAQYGWASDAGLLPAFFGYAVFVTAWAVQLGWIFNNTRGSVLMVAVAHGAGNAWIGGYFDISGTAGVAGNAILAALMVIASLVIVIVAGPRNLSVEARRNTL